MMLMMTAIPVLGITFFVYKMPINIKDQIFKCPTWLLGTICSFSMKFFIHGVMAPYGIIIADIMLIPIFNAMKKLHQYQTRPKDIKKTYAPRVASSRLLSSSIANPA